MEKLIEQEYSIRWGPLIGGIIMILLGVFLALVNRESTTGTYEISLPSELDFKGGLAGLLVVMGGIVICRSLPYVRLRFPHSSSK